MIITINAVEIATILAETKIEDLLLGDYDDVIEQNDDGAPIYTEKGQSMFNEYYDEFFDTLIDNQHDTNNLVVSGNNNVVIS